MMMAADGYYIYNGREAVPPGVTRVRIDESLTVIPARAFRGNRGRNIEEVECHDRVKTVEEYAFYQCPSLRKVIMPGVENVNGCAFYDCKALTIVECGKLERIRYGAFAGCKSLRSIDLPSAKTVEGCAFNFCTDLTNVIFGSMLESIRGPAFRNCTSLERIAIPLKDNMITENDTFQGCEKLKHVDLVEEAVLRRTIDALLLEDWKNDMDREMLSINQILSYTPAGNRRDVGGKAQAVRIWISSVVGKIIHYKAQHHSLLNEAATTLQHALPQDIVIKSVLPFLELPNMNMQR